jgi:hypothetical protein
MSIRKSFLVLVAALTVMLVPAAASAKGSHHGHHAHRSGHVGKHVHRHGHRHMRAHRHGHRHMHAYRHGHRHHRHRDWYRHRHYYAGWYSYNRWYAPYRSGYSTYSVPTFTSGSGSAAPCNCMTKTYRDDGTVIFKDICTQETALGPGGKEARRN